ncbi:uncharacterized protein RAG0_11838 [Rhynchosporium agropyri]|uniref:Uncharacterized protein n=1 Tax=Rhynchosporium agropyri TaxID=914238 RepID=A0A1E1L8H4_9HELO|nr:uncharacterized protein RAG0_11838 [Rhynchosporium agropyri]
MDISNDSENLKSHFDIRSNIIEGRLDQLISSIQAGHPRLYREPALLATLYQDQQEIKNIPNKSFPTGHGHKRISNNSKHRLCSCHRYPQATPSYIWGISWSQAIRPQSHCPLSRYAQQRIDTLGAKYSFCTNALGFSVVATLSMARGAGFSISPHFIIRAIVPDDSPSFRLLDLNYKDLVVSDDYLDRAKLVLQELTTLFRDGKAAPTDVRADGSTLLHIHKRETVVTGKLVSPLLNEGDLTFVTSKPYTSSDSPLCGLPYCASPIIKCGTGVPFLIEISDILELASKSSESNSPDDDLIEVLVKLFNNELALEHTGIGSIGGNRSMIVHKALSRMSKEQLIGNATAYLCSGFELPEICRAIWLRDEVELRESIELAPEYLNQAFENGETPLHLTVSWPGGLAILLENKAAVSKCNNYGLTIMHAKSHYGSPLGGKWDQNEVLSELSFWGSLDVQHIFISDLVSRRQRLLLLARDELPALKLQTLNLREDCVLDAQAAPVTSALLERREI